MSTKEMIAEIRAAAASLMTAAGIKDALFRAESLLIRIRQGELRSRLSRRPLVCPTAKSWTAKNLTGDGTLGSARCSGRRTPRPASIPGKLPIAG